MDTLNKDELFTIAIHLDLPDLVRFCTLNKKFHDVCPNVWRSKIAKEFPEFQYDKLSDELKKLSLQNIYIFLYTKKVWGWGGSIDELFFAKMIDLHNWRISIIPEYLYLPNLKELFLYSNDITRIPSTLNLPNLEELFIFNNPIKFWPKDFNLPKLKILHLDQTGIPQNLLKYYTKKYPNVKISPYVHIREKKKES